MRESSSVDAGEDLYHQSHGGRCGPRCRRWGPHANGTIL